jgi:hypothetical protein
MSSGKLSFRIGLLAGSVRDACAVPVSDIGVAVHDPANGSPHREGLLLFLYIPCLQSLASVYH